MIVNIPIHMLLNCTEAHNQCQIRQSVIFLRIRQRILRTTLLLTIHFQDTPFYFRPKLFCNEAIVRNDLMWIGTSFFMLSEFVRMFGRRPRLSALIITEAACLCGFFTANQRNIAIFA